MESKKLTDEQVQMLIEDGTLDKAVLLAEESKEKEMQEIEDFLQSMMPPENTSNIPEAFFEKYWKLATMMEFGMSIPSKTPEELYLARNLILARYTNFVENILSEMSTYILEYYMGNYHEYYNYSCANTPVFIKMKHTLCDLNFMNYFVSVMNINILGSYAQAFIEDIAYKLHCAIPQGTSMSLNIVKKSSENPKSINAASIAYSFFNDISRALGIICSVASICLKGIQKYTIDPNVAAMILQPAPIDMTEPLNSYYNSHPMDYCNDNPDKPKKRLYTKVNNN